NRKAERTLLEKIDDALLHRRDEVAGDNAALDLILKHKAGAARQRLDVNVHIAELTVTAGLPFVAAMLTNRFLDRLLIRDLRRVGDDLETVFARELFDRDLQVDFTLPGQRHLLQAGILMKVQRWV